MGKISMITCANAIISDQNTAKYQVNQYMYFDVMTHFKIIVGHFEMHEFAYIFNHRLYVVI